MDEEFYNAFATPSTPITVAQTTMLENEMGTMQKPPKLLNIEEYKGWEGRFENWVQANYLDAWECKKVKTPVSSDDETTSVIRKKVKVPEFKIDEEAIAKKSPIICENCEVVKKQNSSLIHNMNRLKESYDMLNKAMNMYNNTSEEQAIAMKTLQGAFMVKQKVVNNYIEKCANLEQKLELQRIETERVNCLLKSYSCSSYVIDRIYPMAES
ncbi:hypothetical protein HanOQP8_Chr02g0046391 [Helianthus annuus]|nr:hypothetical protein HanOQP8_Chr02g0046391 [Helianthus annuus]